MPTVQPSTAAEEKIMMERAQENEAFESEKGIVAVAKEIATLEKEIADQEKSIKDPVWRVGSQEEKVQKEIDHLEKEFFTQKEKIEHAYNRDIALIKKKEEDTLEKAEKRVALEIEIIQRKLQELKEAIEKKREREVEERTNSYESALASKGKEFDNYITKKRDQLELLDSKKEKILENTKSPVSLNKKKRLLQEKIKSYDGKVGAYKMIYPKKYHREICDNYRDCRGYRWNCDSEKVPESFSENLKKCVALPKIFEEKEKGSENFKIFEKQSPTLFETAPPKIDQLPPSNEESFSSRYIREQKEIEAREKRTLNYQPDSLEREFQKQEAELLIARKNAEEEWKKWEAEHS